MDRTELERIAADPESPYFERGRALEQLLSNNDWRLTHSRADAYCRQRCKVSGKRALQLIEASHVYWLLRRTSALKLPSEEQALAMASVSSEYQEDVWDYALRHAPQGIIGQTYLESVCERFSGQAEVAG